MSKIRYFHIKLYFQDRHSSPGSDEPEKLVHSGYYETSLPFDEVFSRLGRYEDGHWGVIEHMAIDMTEYSSEYAEIEWRSYGMPSKYLIGKLKQYTKIGKDKLEGLVIEKKTDDFAFRIVLNDNEVRNIDLKKDKIISIIPSAKPFKDSMSYEGGLSHGEIKWLIEISKEYLDYLGQFDSAVGGIERFVLLYLGIKRVIKRTPKVHIPKKSKKLIIQKLKKNFGEKCYIDEDSCKLLKDFSISCVCMSESSNKKYKVLFNVMDNRIKIIRMKKYAFVDEYGTNSLEIEKEGVSSHFVVCALLIEENKLEESELFFESVRKKHFQTGEMKSSGVGINHRRRLAVIKDLLSADFGVYAFVIDKSELTSKGFQYKQTFYKFCNRLLYDDLFKSFQSLSLSSDEHGSKEYMEGFRKYVRNRTIRDLFNQSEFDFVPSKSDIFIQVADIFAGTIGKCFDKKADSPFKDDFFSITKNKIIAIKEFPQAFENFVFSPTEQRGEFDSEIFHLAIRLAKTYIEDNKKSNDSAEIDRMKCLHHLLFFFQFYNPNEYIPTHNLIKILEGQSNRNIGIQYFRSQIIAKLRDGGVILSSSSKGYKLPANEYDLYEFVNQSSRIIIPMLERLKKCRTQILLLSNNRLDILDKPEYKLLSNQIDP